MASQTHTVGQAIRLAKRHTQKGSRLKAIFVTMVLDSDFNKYGFGDGGEIMTGLVANRTNGTKDANFDS